MIVITKIENSIMICWSSSDSMRCIVSEMNHKLAAINYLIDAYGRQLISCSITQSVQIDEHTFVHHIDADFNFNVYLDEIRLGVGK